jgi:DNA-binding response OmpR family regulator
VRILIIEDDPDIAANLYDFFESRGHVADRAGDGVTGLHFAVTQHYDAILLDLSLPGLDGFELCRKLRGEARRDTPVLMLTARDTLEDRLTGFEQGADDYLVKPFALREVEARLLALNKRYQRNVAPRVLSVGDVRFDPDTLAVTLAGAPVKLPPKCLRLLELMLQRPGHVFSRVELESAVWGDSLESSDTLRTHMHVLRRALSRPGHADILENVHGMGYRIVEPHGRA